MYKITSSVDIVNGHSLKLKGTDLMRKREDLKGTRGAKFCTVMWLYGMASPGAVQVGTITNVNYI